MAISRGGVLQVSEALTVIADALDRVCPDRSGLDHRTKLECVQAAKRLADRLQALTSLLLAEADATQASLRAAGTPTSAWAGLDAKLSKREAAGMLHQARRLAGHPTVGQAATAGKIGAGQAQAITKVLESLAPQLGASQQAQAEQVLVDLAGELDADQLAKSAGRVLQAVAPRDADELLEQKLQRETEAAYRGRSLRSFRDGASVRFDGSLPRLEAEQWMAS